MLRTVPGLEGEGQAARPRNWPWAYVGRAESSGEQLRPATLEELEAAERAAAEARAARFAREEGMESASTALEGSGGEGKTGEAVGTAPSEVERPDLTG